MKAIRSSPHDVANFLETYSSTDLLDSGTDFSNGGASSLLAGKLFIVIGAGGAAKALAFGAKVKGARVVIANRTYGKFPSCYRNYCDDLMHFSLPCPPSVLETIAMI
ncbi:hypothetical protein Nepgr_000343 [Nepenthes gracilis]|uniref:Uncharacterized protein n=1 Tax=Nepenthes gracilis TaxID=150966 RepID=A0AAD3RW63_NEPGR|nr:hypothetical protein Nepgr_000343 [Nepenthes gracilis]